MSGLRNFTCSSVIKDGEAFWNNTQLQQSLKFPSIVKSRTRHSQQKRLSMSITNTVSDTKVVQAKPSAPRSGNAWTIQAILTIRKKAPKHIRQIFSEGLDFFVPNPNGSDISLQLVSTTLDRSTGCGKRSIDVSLKMIDTNEKTVQYIAQIIVDSEFGKPGAIFVTNKHKTEFFLETISLTGFEDSPVWFSCYSWVHSQNDSSTKRVFFYNEPYLPDSTPPGLKDLRDTELATMRGNGKGVRKPWERIYDYDVYNDLGNPDKATKHQRPPAGGDDLPYPRRCRTGRSPTKTDPLSESRIPVTRKNYVPRDEDFEEIKSAAFSSGRLRAIVHKLVPAIKTHFTVTPDEFDSFTDIDRLYMEGIELQDESGKTTKPLLTAIMQFLNMGENLDNALRYPVPQLFEKDKFAWTRDSEFGRQMLAGLNPLHVKRLEAFPPVSALDEKVYGPLTTALDNREIEKHLDGLSVEEAIQAEKLFILDYHDVFLPLVDRINAMEGRKCYATRTILFLDSSEVFRPVAIELSLPASISKPGGRRRAFYPQRHASGFWLWKLAKAHVNSNHAAYHQVVTHWLQTHAAVEPYVIATNRQLSNMHPVFKLLDPHLRYTMQINATARQTLISADGVIEKCFTPGPYTLEVSVAGYRSWRFDKQGLPADLLDRGMAVEDENSPHGLKLVIEDYPYAADGLMIWSALKSFVQDYVSIFYEESSDEVVKDEELQAWWNEIKTKGHPDKKEGWPELKTNRDLVDILTTMMWIASGHHAAVNFGQFLYSGYVPNMPCMTRKLIPEEDDPEYQSLVSRPQQFMLKVFPNQVQATTVMAVLELLSTHHPDEEYLGDRTQRQWIGSDEAVRAAEKFKADIMAVQDVITCRNRDPNLRHRHGAGVPPYELLLPFSKAGITACGVPNSVSI